MIEQPTKVIHLKPHEEAVGTYQGLRSDEYHLSILFGGFEVVFRADSTEAEIIERCLATTPVGNRVSILVTDLNDHPVLLRVLTDSDALEVYSGS